jgi:hypothetical protein
MNGAKTWYKSKTFWFNVLTLLVVVGSGLGYAGFEPDPEIQVIGAGLVAVVNLGLRLFATGQPIAFKR